MNNKSKGLLLVIAIVLLGGCICISACLKEYYDINELIAAIENEDVYKVEKILNKGVDPNSTSIPPSKLWSFFEMSAKRPLAIACGTGNLEIVRLLINYGATAEPIEETGFSPLRETLFYYQPDDVEIVSLLLENGASTMENLEGPLVFSAAQMIPRVYDKTKANGTVFSGGYDEDTAKGITEIVCKLLNEQNLDIATNAGETLLMLAVQKENIYLAEYLITAGCDDTAIDVNGKTALDYATETKNDELIAVVAAGK